MEATYISLAAGRATLSDLIQRTQAGESFVITVHGKPKAVLGPVPGTGKPWRAPLADDPGRYGDLQKPVLEDWA